MKVPPEEVKYLARLAKLELSDTEIDNYSKKLSVVLDYMDKLNQIDTSDVEPLTHPVDISNVFRDDVSINSLPHEAALRNAPLHDGNYFLVPKVIK